MVKFDEMEREEFVEEVETAEVEASAEWTLADGTACSKSAFVREQFLTFNKSRKEISEEYDIPYRTVYGATVNMENDAEPTSRGRGTTFSKIDVTEDGKLVVVKDDVVFIDGVEAEEMPETIEMDRNEWIKNKVAEGVSRGDVAKMLDLSYGVVYGLTKDLEGARQKYEVEVDGKVISRSEYIRQLASEGISRADIAKQLEVEYSVVWQATKKMKSVEEKFFEAIAALEKFIDQVEAPEVLTNLMAQLEAVKIKEEEAEVSEEDAE